MADRRESEAPPLTLMSLEKGSPSPPAIPSPNSGLGVRAGNPAVSSLRSAPQSTSRDDRTALGSVSVAKSAVFIDLDRTLLCRASGQVLNQALVDEGVLPEGRSLPGDKLLYAVNDRLGENLLSMGLVRAAARVARGWRQEQVQAAGRRAVAALSELVAPFAPQRLAAFRAEGHRLVLTTTTPVDMIAPFAEAFGFDDLIATAYETEGRPLHRPPLRGLRVGHGQAARGAALGRRPARSTWPTATPAATASSTSRCSRASARPHAVNPDPSLTIVATARRWPVEHWDRPPGVPSVIGLEPYHLLRPFVRKLSFPYARFDIAGVEHVPTRGPGPAGLQPPELLRRGRAGPRGARDRPARALPRQEGDLRCARGRDDRTRHRRHRGRPGQRIGPAPAGRRGRAEGGRGGDRPPAGDHPAWLRLLRPGAAGQDGNGPSGRVDRCHGGARRAVGHREGVATLGAGARLHPGAQPAHGHRCAWASRSPSRSRTPRRTRRRSWRPSRALLPPEARVRHEPTPRSWLAPSPLGEGAARQRDDTRGQRDVAPPRTGPGNRGRRPGRAPPRPPAPRAPDAGRQVALVTGTNGKTTTTRLLDRGAGRDGGRRREQRDRVRTCRPGHVAALAGTDAPRAVLEVDEVYLPRVLAATSAAAVVLLNLSRDQLDRTNEVRMVAGRWRAALAAAPHTHVVANADDPLVAWGAGAARHVHWVGAGLRWQLDAVGLPLVRGPYRVRRWHLGLYGVRLCPPGHRRLTRARARTGRPRRCGPTDGRTRSGLRCPVASTRPTRSWRPWPPRPAASTRWRPRGHGGRRARWPAASRCASFGGRAGPADAGQEPGGMGRAARPRGGLRRAARGEHQRPGGRRCRPQLVVGRALRAPGRSIRRGDRGPFPRPLGPTALRGGRAHDRRPTRSQAVRRAPARRRGTAWST